MKLRIGNPQLFVRTFFCMLVGVSGLLISAGAAAQYTDVIHLRNGDRITGNIKELDRGKLRVSTLTMDTVYLHWVDVESIESSKYLRIEKTDGGFNYGRLQQTETPAALGVVDNRRLVELPTSEVAAVRPLRVDDSFWARLEGEVKSGIDYKRASDVFTLNLASSIRLREEKYEIGFSADWNETRRTENNNASRANLAGDYTRFLRDRWFWRGTGGFERNDELGINLRAIATASAGRYLLRNSMMRLEVNAGIAANREFRSGVDDVTSLEGVVRSSFDIFVFNVPKTILEASVSLFPGITESGRFRTSTDIGLKSEFVRDLFWDLTFYSTSDNQPPQGAQSSDYGIVTSLGASF